MKKAVESWRWNPVDLAREEWRSAYGFVGYLISNMGRAKRLAKPPPSIMRELLLDTKDGFVNMARDRKTYDIPIARLILEAFVSLPPTDKHVARHLDDNRDNNVLGNLAWGTSKDNAQDAVRNGRLPSQVGKFVSFETREKLRIIALNVSQETRRKQAETLRDTWRRDPLIWISNGVEDKRISEEHPIPEGWFAGRSPAVALAIARTKRRTA